jgi:hypothetical protein
VAIVAMPIQKISLETLQKIRHHIRVVLTLPEVEDHPGSRLPEGEEPPEPDSLSNLGDLFNFGAVPEIEPHAPNAQGKWFISSTNPGSALMKLPGLRLKPGLRLVTYLHRTVEQGLGVTWAIPEEFSRTYQLEKVLTQHSGSKTLPQPEGALKDLMEAVEGDRSPLSLIAASVLWRELKELGALGKACDWSHHRLIDSPPSQAHWQWQVSPPKDLSPKVLIHPDGKAAIEFFTCRVSAPVALHQHIDQYPLAHYKAASIHRVVAVPKRAN